METVRESRARQNSDLPSERAVTESIRRISKTRLRLIWSEVGPYPEDVQRPVTRADCERSGTNEDRPCPFASCRHHLAIDIHGVRGSIKINFPDRDADEIPETCSLDVAERGGVTLEEVGEVMNLTRERTRQIEVLGCKSLRESGDAAILAEYAGQIGERSRSPLAIAQESDGAIGRGAGGTGGQDWHEVREQNRPKRIERTYTEQLATPLIEEDEMGRYTDKNCKGCGKRFEPRGPRQHYCNRECRLKHTQGGGIGFPQPSPTQTPRPAEVESPAPAPSRPSPAPAPSRPSPAPDFLGVVPEPGEPVTVREVLELAGFKVDAVTVPNGTLLLVQNPGQIQKSV